MINKVGMVSFAAKPKLKPKSKPCNDGGNTLRVNRKKVDAALNSGNTSKLNPAELNEYNKRVNKDISPQVLGVALATGSKTLSAKAAEEYTRILDSMHDIEPIELPDLSYLFEA